MMFKHFVQTIESKYENSWLPSFFEVYHPQLPPMMWGKIWNVHKNIRTLHKDHKKQKWNGGLVILAEKWWIFTFLTPKSPPKPPKITFSKNPKKRFLLVPRRVLIPNFKSLCRKLRPGAPGQAHTDKKLKKGEYFSTSLEQTRGRNESVGKGDSIVRLLVRIKIAAGKMVFLFIFVIFQSS